ncbi:MAG: hypothetical protein AAFP19_14720 [Bacteroidota bacterium]
MENKDFDQFIRDQLDGLGENWAPGNWDLFEQKLNQQIPDSSQEDSSLFDQLLSEKLDQLGTEPTVGDWDLMSERLDAEWAKPDLEEVYLDGVAYENLTNLAPPYNPSHWKLMSERLDAEYSLRLKLYKYKITEVALMLLAIFTLLQYVPLHQELGQLAKIGKKNTQQELAIVPSTTTDATLAEKTIQADLSTTQVQERFADTQSAQVPTNQSQQISSNVALASTGASDAITATIQEEAHVDNSPTTAKAANHSENSDDPWDNSVDLLPIKKATLSQLLPEGIASQAGLTLQPGISDWATMPTISSPRLALDETTPALPNQSDQLHQKKTRLRIGMFASTEANYIMTPYNTSSLLPSYDQFFLGYGGGLSVSFQFNRWEIETGGVFSSMYYTPERYRVSISGEFEEGFSSIGFKDAQLEILRIPLNLSYTFFQKNRWNIYAMTGATVNAAIYTNYDLQEVYPGSRNSFSASPIPGPPDGGVSIVQEEKARYKGYFESGSLEDNLYFSANIGLGIERVMSRRWSIFVQPLYQHTLKGKGFGPNEDRFNHLSTYFGVRANLK